MSTLKYIINENHQDLHDRMVQDKFNELNKYVQPNLDDFYSVQAVNFYELILFISIMFIDFIALIFYPINRFFEYREMKRFHQEEEQQKKNYIRRQIRSVARRYLRDFNDPSINSLMERNMDNELIRESHTWNKVNHIRKYQTKGSSWNQMKTWLEQYDKVNTTDSGKNIIDWILKTDV